MAASARVRVQEDLIGLALRGKSAGSLVVISKTRLAKLPASYEETALGYPPSTVHAEAYRQYRGPYRRHVYETATAWIAHRDAADPRHDPLGHFLKDTPELAIGAGVGLLAGGIAAYGFKKRRLEKGGTKEEAQRDAILGGLIIGLLAGGAAAVIVTLLKKSTRR